MTSTGKGGGFLGYLHESAGDRKLKGIPSILLSSYGWDHGRREGFRKGNSLLAQLLFLYFQLMGDLECGHYFVGGGYLVLYVTQGLDIPAKSSLGDASTDLVSISRTVLDIC